MTQREKLIELLKKFLCEDENLNEGSESVRYLDFGCKTIADYLLANGVAVDEKPIIIHEPTSSQFRRMAIQNDYVKVVRCEDCDYRDYFLMKHGVVYCYKIGREVNSGFFCADGERRADE